MLKRISALAASIFLFAWVVLATATQFNVTTQIKGVLAVANGGTGSSAGIVPTLGTVTLTSQTATKTISTLCGTSAGQCNTAGQYQVEWNFWGSRNRVLKHHSRSSHDGTDLDR